MNKVRCCALVLEMFHRHRREADLSSPTRIHAKPTLSPKHTTLIPQELCTRATLVAAATAAAAAIRIAVPRETRRCPTGTRMDSRRQRSLPTRQQNRQQSAPREKETSRSSRGSGTQLVPTGPTPIFAAVFGARRRSAPRCPRQFFVEPREGSLRRLEGTKKLGAGRGSGCHPLPRLSRRPIELLLSLHPSSFSSRAKRQPKTRLRRAEGR